jgi:hypothetical protein
MANKAISDLTAVDSITDATLFEVEKDDVSYKATGTQFTTYFGTPMTAATYDPAGIEEQLVGLTATQTLTGKTLTTPTITLKQGAAPAPTAEGDVQWDTDDDTIKVGDGSGTKTFSDDSKVALVANNLSDMTAATVRTNLNLVIGTDVQAWDADLDALAGLTSAANKVPMFSGSGTATLLDFKDEDDLVSDSATAVASQQSIKAYVDTAVTGGVSDGDKGDITVSGTGATWTIDADTVTYDKMQDTSATDVLLGRSTAGAGTVEEIACTAFGRSILDDADEATFKATVNLEIGTDVQAYDSVLDTPVGQQTIWVPAVAMYARTTTGAASGSTELATNDVMVKTFDFDASADEHVQFAIQMPKNWDEGTLVFQAVWSHPSTTTNFGVVFFCQAVAFANDDALDTAFGTAVSVTDTGGTTDDLYISPESAALTVAGTPGAEEYVVFQIYRDVSDASDTMAVDARLHGVKIHYTTDVLTDD